MHGLLMRCLPHVPSADHWSVYALLRFAVSVTLMTRKDRPKVFQESLQPSPHAPSLHGRAYSTTLQ